MMEQWRPVLGFEDYYEVSDFGRVRSVARKARARYGLRTVPQRFLKLTPWWTGSIHPYAVVQFRVDGTKSSAYVHVLVLEAFDSPRPPGKQTRHLNGQSADNRLINLCWGTALENGADRVRHGTSKLQGWKHHV